MSYVRCNDDEFEVIEEFNMPLERDAWLYADISRELDILGAEIKNNELIKKENVK